MMSLRSMARSAPRLLSRTTTGSALRPCMAATPSSSLSKAAAVSAWPSSFQSFSTTPGRRSVVAGETDQELSAKLDSEIQIEDDIKANEQEPASVKDFLANSPFELKDEPGQEAVKLVRSFGDEVITVSFSIADITNYSPYDEDAALEDDELAEDSPAGKDGSSSAQPDDQAEDEMRDEMEEEEESAPPINLSIVVEKPGKKVGALNIEATAQDGQVVVDNMFYYDDVNVAKADSFKHVHDRAHLYAGPPFGSLDEDLQVMMERFLEERGITQALAVFVPDYVDLKEQREYMRWLRNVKTFVDA